MTEERYSSVSVNCEVMDSELLRIEQVVNKLNERQWTQGVNLEAFRKEIIERFGEIGFRVGVEVWSTDQEGLYAFDIVISDRLEGEFDPDRMVSEVTNDILGLGTGGVIKAKSGLHLLQGGAEHSHGSHSHSHGSGGSHKH